MKSYAQLALAAVVLLTGCGQAPLPPSPAKTAHDEVNKTIITNTDIEDNLASIDSMARLRALIKQVDDFSQAVEPWLEESDKQNALGAATEAASEVLSGFLIEAEAVLDATDTLQTDFESLATAAQAQAATAVDEATSDAKSFYDSEYDHLAQHDRDKLRDLIDAAQGHPRSASVDDVVAAFTAADDLNSLLRKFRQRAEVTAKPDRANETPADQGESPGSKKTPSAAPPTSPKPTPEPKTPDTPKPKPAGKPKPKAQPKPKPKPKPAWQDVVKKADAAALCNAINNARAANGVGKVPCSADAFLMDHAVAMAKAESVYHSSQDRIVAGAQCYKGLVDAWLASTAGHREYLLHPDTTAAFKVGVASRTYESGWTTCYAAAR